MPPFPACDEELLPRLPMPLARLARRAGNARSPLEMALTAFYLWESALKLLGSVAVVAYAERPDPSPAVSERLTNLARPALGHWWEFVRLLVPILAENDELFAPTRDLLLGRKRDDLPHAAGLDALLRELLDGKGGARGAVSVAELFDRLVRLRNQELGHGAAGQRPAGYYERLAHALLAAVGELLPRLDLFTRGRLLALTDVRQAGGRWLVQRYALVGETPRRLEALKYALDAVAALPRGEQVYFEHGGVLRSLHPLLLFDSDGGDVLFLNARRGKRRAEYLNYATGQVRDLPDLGGEQRALLARVLDVPVAEERAEAWAARSQAEEPPGPTSEVAGARTLGEFELLSELGRGGMGVVYRAWQPSLGRQVAVKELLRSGDARSEARFAREVRALGRVEHPHLVKIFTSGSDGGRWFYAMELLDGAPLSAVCAHLQTRSGGASGVDPNTWQEALTTIRDELRRGEKPLADVPPPAPRPVESPAPGRGYVAGVVELMIQAAEAAHALHEAGILHRDIKPGNILLTPSGQAVLMDLGLAQLADEEDGRLTRTRQFVGTLRYASPQQVLAVGNLDRRTDVYGLGATLWEMLTLRPLFGATDATPTPELMEKIQRDDPERVRKYNPAVAPDLEAIVHKCLEKSPDRRYATTRALADDLRRFQQGEPVRARPVSGAARALRWMARRPALTGLLFALAVAALALVGVGVSLYYGDRLARSLHDTLEAFDEAERQRRLAEELRVQSQYLADLRNAWGAWGEGQLPALRDILQPYRAAGPADPRGFEWHFLDRLSRAPGARRWKAHGATVTAVAFSPDGRRFATGAADGSVTVWDSDAVTEVRAFYVESGLGGVGLPGFRFDARAEGLLVTAADGAGLEPGDLVVAAAEEGRPFLPATGLKGGEAEGLLRNRPGSRLRLRVVPRGGGDPREVVLTRALPTRPSAEPGGPTLLAFAPGGKYLAAARGRTLRLWDMERLQEVRSWLAPHKSVQGLAWAPAPDARGGDRLVTACGADGTLCRWEAGRDGPVWRERQDGWRPEDAASPFTLGYLADGSALAVSGSLHTLRLLDPETGRVRSWVQHPALLTGGFHRFTASPDARLLAVPDDAANVVLWDLAARRPARWLSGNGRPLNALAFAPDGARVVAAGPDGVARCWDVSTGLEAARFRGHEEPVTALAFDPSGARLATGAVEGFVHLWDAGRDQEFERMPGGFPAELHALAFTPDCRGLVAVGGDPDAPDRPGAVYALDARTGAAPAAWQDRLGGCQGLCVLPDNRTLLAEVGADAARAAPWASGENVEQHLDLETGAGGRRPWPGTLAFSPDGKWAAWNDSRAADVDRLVTVVLCDRATGRERARLRGHRGFTSMEFRPDGRALLTWGLHDRTARVWDVATGRATVVAAPGDRPHLGSACLAPDGRMLALATGNVVELENGAPELVLWDLDRKGPQASLKGHRSWVAALAFSPDGKALASGSVEKVVRLWDVATGEETGRFANPFGAGPLAFHPGGRLLACAGNYLSRCPLVIWDLERRRQGGRWDGRGATILGLAYSPDGRRLVCGDRAGAVTVHDPETGELRRVLREDRPPGFDGHVGVVRCAAVAPDGATAATGGDDKTIKLWDRAAGKVKATLTGHRGAVSALAYTPGGAVLASASRAAGEVRLWDGRTGAALGTLAPLDVTCLAFAPHGGLLAVGTGPGTGPAKPQPAGITLHAVADGKVETVLRHDALGAVQAVGFLPESRSLFATTAAAGEEGTRLECWDVASGQRRWQRWASRGPLRALAVAPDGKTVATGGDELKLWHAATGTELLTLRGHRRAVRALAFAPDGGVLACADGQGASGGVLLWRAAGPP